MKLCTYRSEIGDEDNVGCDNIEDLMHGGVVPRSFCQICQYATLSENLNTVSRKQRDERHKPKPCSGCLGPKRRTTKGSHDLQFVWPYWHGGANGDEIRFSVRSVEKFFEGSAKCTIIGDKPPWFTGH